MKTILALTASLAVGTAYAQTDSNWASDSGYFNIADRQEQTQQGQKHMIEFNAQSMPSILYAIQKAKTRGTSSDNDSASTINFNYAYTIHPNVQVGGRFNYFNGIFANNDVERMDVQVGGWFNTKAGDLQNSPYISAHLGTGYAQTFGERGGRDDLWIASAAIGKRFSMEGWGVKNVSWTPEIALVSVNSTNNSSFDYRQATEFRLLQFSVLW